MHNSIITQCECDVLLFSDSGGELGVARLRDAHYHHMPTAELGAREPGERALRPRRRSYVAGEAFVRCTRPADLRAVRVFAHAADVAASPAHLRDYCEQRSGAVDAEHVHVPARETWDGGRADEVVEDRQVRFVIGR